MLMTRRNMLQAFASLPLLNELGMTGLGAQTPDAPSTRPCFLGVAARAEHLQSDKDFAATVAQNCSWLTPEIHLKWDSLEYRPGQHNFKSVDDLLSFADGHGMQVRGHTLIWDQSTPQWAKERLRSERDWAMVDRFFGTVLGRYQSRISQWDVINEPIDVENGDKTLRRTVFHDAFGPTYIERALDSAHALAPSAQLMINEYGFEYRNPVDTAKRSAMLALTERLLKQGAPLHGIGIQAHLDLAKGPLDVAGMRHFLHELAQMGVSIVVTELDVREHDLKAPIELRDRRVADEVRRFLDVALAEPAVTGVITWGLSDRFSWLNDRMDEHRAGPDPVALNRGLPYDVAYTPKPMFYAIQDAMARA